MSIAGYGAIGALRKIWLQILSVMLLLPMPAMAEKVTIVALGDSLVQGYGLSQDAGFVPQMQSWLTANGADAALINAGVSGDTTTGALARVDWVLSPDADALIVSLGGNDILRAIDPELAKANLHSILSKAATRELPVLLVGINVPPNYGADYQEDFEAIYPDLAAEFGTLIYADFLQVLLAFPDRTATYQTYFQPDGLHPNAKGVGLIVEDMGPSLLELITRAQTGN